MITSTAAKKGTGLDDIFKGYVPQQLEEQKKVIVANSAIQEVMKCYKSMLLTDSLEYLHHYNWWSHFSKKKNQLPSLSPIEINPFVQSTIKYEDHPLYAQFTSSFINGLLWSSSREGHHDFYLDLRGMHSFDFLAIGVFCQLDNAIEKPLLTKLTIDGNVGDDFGRGSHSMYYLIRGDIGHFPFAELKDSIILVEGKTAKPGGFRAALDSSFFLHQYYGGIGKSVQNCTFTTDDELTFHNLKKNDYGENNKIYLVDKDNREVILKE